MITDQQIIDYIRATGERPHVTFWDEGGLKYPGVLVYVCHGDDIDAPYLDEEGTWWECCELVTC